MIDLESETVIDLEREYKSKWERLGHLYMGGKLQWVSDESSARCRGILQKFLPRAMEITSM